MINALWTWLFDLVKGFAKFGEWLTTPLQANILGQNIDFFGLSPLALFGFTGLTILIGVHIVKLFL